MRRRLIATTLGAAAAGAAVAFAACVPDYRFDGAPGDAAPPTAASAATSRSGSRSRPRPL